MTKMNKYLKFLTVSMFVIGMSIILRLHFDYSYFLIAIIIGLGLFGKILFSLFFGYANPNQIIFRGRFILYGFGFGLLIGLMLYLTDSVKDQSFSILDLMISLLISVPIGIIFFGIMSSLRFMKLKKRTIGKYEMKDIISDFAIYINSKQKARRGFLVLSSDILSFYDRKSYECIFKIPLSDLNPEIKKSNFLSLPNGFNISNKNVSLKIAFPYFWISTIKARKFMTYRTSHG